MLAAAQCYHTSTAVLFGRWSLVLATPGKEAFCAFRSRSLVLVNLLRTTAPVLNLRPRFSCAGCLTAIKLYCYLVLVFSLETGSRSRHLSGDKCAATSCSISTLVFALGRYFSPHEQGRAGSGESGPGGGRTSCCRSSTLEQNSVGGSSPKIDGDGFFENERQQRGRSRYVLGVMSGIRFFSSSRVSSPGSPPYVSSEGALTLPVHRFNVVCVRS